MYSALFALQEFHKKVGLAIGDPRAPDLSVDTELRLKLIEEEYGELTLAFLGLDKQGNALDGRTQLIAVADALGDLAYVIAGAAVTWGIDIGGVFEEIHRSNMTKLPGNKRSDGKITKGPEYVPPDLERVLQDAAADQSDWWPEPTVSGSVSGDPSPIVHE